MQILLRQRYSKKLVQRKQKLPPSPRIQSSQHSLGRTWVSFGTLWFCVPPGKLFSRTAGIAGRAQSQMDIVPNDSVWKTERKPGMGTYVETNLPAFLVR